jgi:hypothetical protein
MSRHQQRSEVRYVGGHMRWSRSRVCGQGAGDPGEQAPEDVRPVTGKLQVVGDLSIGGLDPVAQCGDRAARPQGPAQPSGPRAREGA